MSKKNWEDEAEDVTSQYSGNPLVGDIDLGEQSEADKMLLPDVAAAALQSASLEWADNAIEQFSPEVAKDFRDYLKAARERNPGATFLADILTPDAVDVATFGLGKLRKVHKVVGMLADMAKKSGPVQRAVGTDLVTQMGEEGPYQPERTVMAGIIGTGAKVGKALTPTPETSRAFYTGVEPKDVVGRVKPLEAKSYIDTMMKTFDNKGLFKYGKMEFDPKTLKWERGPIGKAKWEKGASKVKGMAVPPSQREILTRVEEAKEKIAKEIDFEINAWSGSDRDFAILDVADNVPGTFHRADFQEEIADFMNNVDFDSAAQEKAAADFIEHKFRSVFGGEDSATASLSKIHELRKKFDRVVNYEKVKGKEQWKEAVSRKMANVLRKKALAATSGGGRLDLLNKQYSALSDLGLPLSEKKVLNAHHSRGKAGLLSGNIGYKAATLMEIVPDTVAGVTGQVGKTMEKMPDLGVGGRALRKFTPAMTEPQPQPERGPQSMMSPSERIGMSLPQKLIEARLPRTAEGLAANSKIFKLKVAQESENIIKNQMMAAGKDPEQMDPMEIQESAQNLYKSVDDMVTKRPEEIGSMLPAWVKMFPEMFERDRYDRIDGVVPMSRQPEAREEIRKNPKISNKERIKQLDLLNRSGEYKDN